MPPQVHRTDSGTPVNSQAPVTIEQPKSTEVDKSAVQKPEPPKQDAETAAKNSAAAKQHGEGTRHEESRRAYMKRNELDQKLPERNAGKTENAVKSVIPKEDQQAIDAIKKANDTVLKSVNDAKAELVRKANVQVMRTSLEVSDTKNLKKIIAESEKWPEQNKKILNEAMGHSQVVMKKVAKEFTPNEQLNVINRSYETDKVGPDSTKEHEAALKTWMDNTKSSTLNHVVSNATYSLESKISKQVQDSDVGNFNKLNSANKVRVAELLITDPGSHDLALQKTFENINPKEKNMLIDKFQVSSPRSQSEFMKRSARALDSEFMEGIDKNNGEFMRKTYAYMAENAKTPEEKDLYNKNAMYLENWMDEKFKR